MINFLILQMYYLKKWISEEYKYNKCKRENINMNNNMDFFEGLDLKDEVKNSSKYDIEIDGMKKNDVKKLLKSLRKDEEYHSDLYYNKNTNEISDYEYDKLKRKILEIEEKYPEFTDKNGVRNRVGGRKSL